MTHQKASIKEIKAIIGLGNPGKKYEHTRHNIGFKVVDELAKRYHGTWSENDLYTGCTIMIGQKPVLLVKPKTFMNNSGEVIPQLKKKGIECDQILVVHDELEKPFGKTQVKQGGSHRGHNGLRSLMARCGDLFWRIRCGIGRPENKEDVPDYVLDVFQQTIEEVVEFIENIANLVESLL